MSSKGRELKGLCSVRAGIPVNRLRKNPDRNELRTTRILTPRSIEAGRIIDAELAIEDIIEAKPFFYTRANDIVLKLTAPYDSVCIDERHIGILVASFAVIIRPLPDVDVDMRYIAAFLSLPETTEWMKTASTGSVMPLLKKSAVETLNVPNLSANEQIELASLYENIRDRKEICLRMMQLNDMILESEFSSRLQSL